jgi:hypothetical protein
LLLEVVMRSVFLVTACALGLIACAWLGGASPTEGVEVRLKLVDSATGKDVGGIVRVFGKSKEQALVLPGLFDRLRGLKPAREVKGWYVIPAGGARTTLPRDRLRLEALSGLETALARQEVDLSKKVPKEIVVELSYLFRPEKENLAAGNTHLHLGNLSAENADEYLRKIPAADGIKVMFISYLERKDDDRNYITNRYPVGELKTFRGTGVLFNNGEEHRHNFTAFGQGYGHVMFLDIQKLVRPVSLGPGITGAGDDDRPLRTGIEDARHQGGVVLWCHNVSGHEGIPSALSGRFDALNVFDGSRSGRYEDLYYRYLDIGLRLPLSTGTDWFVYDFSRVYAQVKEELTVKSWLRSLQAGRCVATNGPLLRLSVDGQPPGAVLKIDKPKTVRIEAEGIGRHPFERLQLIQNGKVVQEARSEKKGGGFSARLVRSVRVTEPAWFAVRIDSKARNELGEVLFAHGSPCYVDYQGQRPFDVESARLLLRRLEEAQADIPKKGRFSSPKARATILALYDRAADDLRARINKRGKR